LISAGLRFRPRRGSLQHSLRPRPYLRGPTVKGREREDGNGNMEKRKGKRREKEGEREGKGGRKGMGQHPSNILA